MREITRFDTSQFPAKIAAEVQGFDPLRWVEKKDVKKMDSFIHYAIAAAAVAGKRAGLEVSPETADRTGVFIGSGIGGFNIIEREHNNLLRGGPRKISPFFIPSSIINLAAGQVSIRMGAQGPNSAPLHGLLLGRTCDWRCISNNRPRRCRRDDRRRV